VREHADRLAADVVVVSDTMLWSLREAAVCAGVRGSVTAHPEVRGPRRDIHSGVVAGAAPNPLTELCRLAGLLHDDQGRITLPGFYDTVAEPGPFGAGRECPRDRVGCTGRGSGGTVSPGLTYCLQGRSFG
jgi:acetylornithine deacetylase/succinyl-diaminopimelate desuccinylase-like protein